MRTKNIDLTGQRFGKLTVLGFHETRNRKHYWRCQCDCGCIKNIVEYSLKGGISKSCGCFKDNVIKAVKGNRNRFRDLTNLKFGKLSVVRFYEFSKDRKSIWLCLCECGNHKNVTSYNLISGKTKSCGCLRQDGTKNVRWNGGYSRKDYPKEWNSILRTEIRNRDNHICKYPNCDYDDTKRKMKLDVHHIDGNKRNCQKKNLISLCHSHHSKVEQSPRSWENIFYNITEDYL